MGNDRYNRLVIYFDGASKNNPHGPAGCGWIMYQMNAHGKLGDTVAKGQRYLGHNVSNNQAEYEGLEAALQYLKDEDVSCNRLYIRGDSELVIRQLKGEYSVESATMKRCYREVKLLMEDVGHSFVKYSHVARLRNKEADKLAGNAIEECQSEITEY